MSSFLPRLRLPVTPALLVPLVVLVAACTGGSPAPTPTDTVPVPSSPTPSPTPTVPPIPTPTLTPTVPPTPTPSPTPTVPPTPTPTPTPMLNPGVSNLRPFAPSGRDAPLVVSRSTGGGSTTDVPAAEPVIVSWGFINDGALPVTGSFSVDLYLDGLLVERWAEDGASPGESNPLLNWTGFTSRSTLTPGVHQLRLVIDPLDQVAEGDETDNTFDLELTVTGEPLVPSAVRLPDLRATTRAGWSGPLVANSDGATVDGPLGVESVTAVRYGFANGGQSSVTDRVVVHLYLDGIMVLRESWTGATAEVTISRTPWDELAEVLRITPGEHTLRVAVDPGNLIEELDESNNTFEKMFLWEAGEASAAEPTPTPQPAPEPTAPAPLNAPNLRPAWRFGWDGPIIISQRKETSLNVPLQIGQVPYVDIVVTNESVFDASPFAVDLYFDGQHVQQFVTSGQLRGGFTLWWADWAQLLGSAKVEAGEHTLKLIVDPLDAVAESNEDDNEYEATFEWLPADAPLPEASPYTDEIIAGILATMPDLVTDRRPVIGPESTGNAQAVEAAAEAGYFLLTGKRLADDAFIVLLLDDQGYNDFIDESFKEDFALSKASEYPDVLVRREELRAGSLGFKTRHLGRATVVVHAERPFSDVVSTLVHELGHAQQDIRNPDQSITGGSLYKAAILEAEAQQFERAFWLRVGDELGTPMLSYPSGTSFERYVDRVIDGWLENRETSEHAVGHLLQWLAPLDDPLMSDLGDKMRATGELPTALAQALYDRLAALNVVSVEKYVTDRLASLDANLPLIRELAKARLVEGLGPDAEGSPDLRLAGLLAP